MVEFIAGIATTVSAYSAWQAWRTRGSRLDAIAADVADLQKHRASMRSAFDQMNAHDQDIGALCLRAGIKRTRL